MTDKAGLYLHIPFCVKKCKYCDFYSAFPGGGLLDRYTEALTESIKKWGGRFRRPINTVYLGGGTPSLLKERLVPLLSEVYKAFNVTDGAEITLELNPGADAENVLKYAKSAGINRLSVGMQSGIDSQLEILGRTHTCADTVNTVKLARNMGFDNISLDIMIGLPFSDVETLNKSLSLLKELSPEHISAYLLKIEENTVFYREKEKLSLPDDDNSAEQYLTVCGFLKENGYIHYEISNFCKKGFESRHNIKYWKGQEYLGIGPSAHSYFDGRRCYYPRDLKAFLKGNEPVYEGEGGTKDEYIMLGLRLSEGISLSEFEEKFRRPIPEKFIEKCRLFNNVGYVNSGADRISLTERGMLLSNSIITELLECIE